MNAGRLHAVLESIKRDYESNETLMKLEAASQALSSSVRTPNDATATAFQNALYDLYDSLNQSPLNSAVPSELEVLREIGAVDKVGLGLRTEIQSTLDSNKVTPAKAQSELQKIFEVITSFNEVVLQIVTGFEQLKIPYETLDPGRAEIGATIPWHVVNSDLDGLQENLKAYDRTWRTFGELAENNAASSKVRSVGSSALQVFLESTPAIALCVATAIERLCALYKQILEIRLITKQIREKSFPKSMADSALAYEQSVVETELDKIVEDLLKEFGKDKKADRRNELRKGLKVALKFLAKQIDEGVDLEVRAEPPRLKDVADKEGEPTKSDKTKRALDRERATVSRIQKAGAAMKTLSRSGEPVLALEFVEDKKK